MKRFIQATEKWINTCMKNYLDSRAVPDELVGLCLELNRITTDYKTDECVTILEAESTDELAEKYQDWAHQHKCTGEIQRIISREFTTVMDTFNEHRPHLKYFITVFWALAEEKGE